MSQPQPQRQRALSWLSLFASSGTLLCCALPILLVSLGLGSAVVGLTGAMPWLIPLSQHKGWIFLASALMIGLAAWIVLRSKRQCPTDSELALLCNKMQRQNLHLLIVSATIWGLGFLSAYLLVPLSRLLE